MAWPVGEMCAPEAPPTRPVPGFEMRFTQAVVGFVPGCSGKVVPGAPGSANATAAVAVISAAVAMPVDLFAPRAYARRQGAPTKQQRTRLRAAPYARRGTATKLRSRPTTPESSTMPVSAWAVQPLPTRNTTTPRYRAKYTTGIANANAWS
jgi:hypothetical protein